MSHRIRQFFATHTRHGYVAQVDFGTPGEQFSMTTLAAAGS